MEKKLYRAYWWFSLLLLFWWGSIMWLWIINIVLFMLLGIYLGIFSHTTITRFDKTNISPVVFYSIHRYILPVISLLLIWQLFWLFAYWLDAIFSFLAVLSLRLLTLRSVIEPLKEEGIYLGSQQLTPSSISFVVWCVMMCFVIYIWSFWSSGYGYIILSSVLWYGMYVIFSYLFGITFEKTLSHVSTKIFFGFFLFSLFWVGASKIPKRFDDHTITQTKFEERDDISVFDEERPESLLELEDDVETLSREDLFLETVLDDVDDWIVDVFLDVVEEESIDLWISDEDILEEESIDLWISDEDILEEESIDL